MIRLLLSVLLAFSLQVGRAGAAPSRAGEVISSTAPENGRACRTWSTIPRGVVVTSSPVARYLDDCAGLRGGMLMPWISAGDYLVPLMSYEGQAIAGENNPVPVNLGADGSIQGRRYHRTKRIPDDWCCRP